MRKQDMVRALGLPAIVGCLSLGSAVAEKEKPQPVKVPAKINHGSFDRLLRKYVDQMGLVAYAEWKANAEDMAGLDKYLKQYAATAGEVNGNDKAAALINACNGFTLQWILKNYPTESIWSLEDSFTARRHKIGDKNVSLDDIEKGTLIPQIGWKDHAALVCAVHSCPPLRREAYQGSTLDEQIAKAYRNWLARPDLNEYFPDKNKVEISSIFKWYKSDFAKAGGPPEILAQYGPSKFEKFVSGKKYEVDFKSYHWGLNDQGEHGRNYSKVHLPFGNLF